MWDQVYTPVGAAWCVRPGRGIAHRRHAHFAGLVPAGRLEIGLLGLATVVVVSGTVYGMPLAPSRECHALRRRFWPVPDRLDRILGGGAVPPDGRGRPVRDHQELGRPPHPGSPPAGASDCVRLRRLRRGSLGFGTPVAVASAMLAGPGFFPLLRSGHLPAGEHGAGRFCAIGAPLITLAGVTSLPLATLSAGVGRICAPLSLFIPTYLILVMSGTKGSAPSGRRPWSAAYPSRSLSSWCRTSTVRT